MSKTPLSVSDRLRILQATFGAKLLANGHVYMDRQELSAFVEDIGKTLDRAKHLEDAYAQSEWNRQAYFDMLVAQLGRVSEVLKLFKPDNQPVAETNVIPLRPHQSEPPAPTGGDAA